VRVVDVRTALRGRTVVREYQLVYRRADGGRQELVRQVCDRGDSAAILLYCRTRPTILLTRQFRLPVFLTGVAGGMSFEVPGGLLDGRTPADAVLREADEEAGVQLDHIEEVLVAYPSPALLSERVHLFIGAFQPAGRISLGGGLAAEGEDIDVAEVPFTEALAMVARGDIADMKTILLLYYAHVHHLIGHTGPDRLALTQHDGLRGTRGSPQWR
jgi:nudix-type nucleoside diphosphatase (YffH/AdpP family)